MTINSHIQMPICVLQRFEDKDHRFFYYGVKKGIIGSNGHPSSINTEKGFYSKEAENYLRDNVETPFGNVLKMVDEIGIDPPRGHIDSVFDYTAKWFGYALVSRNPKHIDRIKEYPFLVDNLTEQQLHEMGMLVGFAAEIERDFLSKYVTTLAFNTTDIPFVLPTCGLYFIMLGSVENLVLPVSPDRAIVFIAEEQSTSIIHDGIVHPIRLDNVNNIEIFNRQAAYSQLVYGNGYVVSANREALETALQESKKMIGFPGVGEQ